MKFSLLVVCLTFLLICTEGRASNVEDDSVADIPSDWKARVDSAKMLYSPTELADINLMPAVANGFIGFVVGSDSMYSSGVYVYSKETVYGYIDPTYEGAKRARIPSTLSISINISSSSSSQSISSNNNNNNNNNQNNNNNNIQLNLLGIAVDLELAVVYKRYNITDLLSQTTLATVEQSWFAHKVNRSLLVSTVTIETLVTLSSDIIIHLTPLQVENSKDIGFADVSRNASFAKETVGKLVKAETPDAPLVQVAVVTTPLPLNYTIVAGQPPSKKSPIALFTTIRTSLESSNPSADAYQDFVSASSGNVTELLVSHQSAWLGLWEVFGIDLVPTPGSPPSNLSATINATIYNLLGQMRDDFPFPINTGSLATNGYDGMYWWDMDFWIMPSLLFFQPQWVKIAIDYRFDRLAEAKAHAQKHGFQGAYFPWQTAYTGVDVSFVPPANVLEQHIAADVVLLVKQYWDLTNDTDWLKNIGSPITMAVAEFWISRMSKNADGTYSIHSVVGPDEFSIGELSVVHFPYTGVSNNVFTNAAAQIVIEFAYNVSVILGESFPSDWLEMSRNLVILFDEKHQRHPEYHDYPAGNLFNDFKVKQADVTLLGYPLAYPMTDEIKQNDLEYYESVYFTDGPGMTSSISSIIWMDLGNKTNAYDRFSKAQRNLQKPFHIWTETPNPSEHKFDMGCYMFMTSAGGFLQNVLNGFFGLRLSTSQLSIHPTQFPDTDSMRVRGVFYRDWRFNIVFYANSTLSLLPTENQGTTVLFAQSTRSTQGTKLAVGVEQIFTMFSNETVRIYPQQQ